MKKLLILTMMLLFTLSASAQLVSAARDTQGVRFGMRGSVALSSMNQTADLFALSLNEGGAVELRPLAAFAVGFAWDIPVLKSFHFNLELKYTMKGERIKSSGSIQYHDYKSVRSDRLSYIELPIQPQFRLNFSPQKHLNLNAGPYVAFAVIGCEKERIHFDYRGERYDVRLNVFTGRSYTKNGHDKREWTPGSEDFKAFYNRFDFGVAFGTDYVIDRFHVGVSFDLGLIDIYELELTELYELFYTPIKNRTALFTLGFDF